jgi:hypothetical protein
MSRKVQTQSPFFEVGNKVQLKPKCSLLGRKTFEGLQATITRIEPRPSPDFLDLQTEEDWEWSPRQRTIFFWVRLDDFPGLDDPVRPMEIPFRYRELRMLDGMEDFHP